MKIVWFAIMLLLADLFWKYELPNKKHHVKVILKNPPANYGLSTWDYLIYADKPVNAMTGSR
jgi:hypothetical protein